MSEKVEDLATTAPAERAQREPRSALSQELAIIAALWRRDMLHLLRERSRWLGVVMQPLFFWFLLGSGMADTFKLGSGESYLHFFFPGVLIMVPLFSAIYGTITIIEDRKSGFLQGVLVAPGSRISLVLGKVCGICTMVLIQSALFVAMAPLAGYAYGTIHWPILALVMVLTTVGLTGLTVTMAWVLSSSQAYHAIMSVVLLPLWIVSGAMFPAGGNFMRYVIRANPLGYAVEGTRAALGGSGDLALSLLVLGGFATLTLAMAAAVSRR
ncbi:MAG: ABC transporter permease [Myxococcales bacterium]|nr:ABC transporter permease [Myxococcales bacterium]